MANLAAWRERIFNTLPQNNFIQRCIAGTLLALAAIGAIWVVPDFFPVLVWLFILIAVREWQRMAEPVNYRESVHYLYSAILLIAVVQAMFGTRAGFAALVILSFSLWLVARHIRLARPLWFAASILYLGAPPLALIALHQNYTIGAEIVTYFFGVIWATDTAAYVIGRQLGGMLLAPDVSPKKTWSGLIGGLVAGALAGMVAENILNTAHFWGTLAMSVGLSLTAQMSDLAQSRIKRFFQVKDTGGVIPGHGGVMDRIDSLMLSAPLYAFIQFVMGRPVPW